MILGELVFQRLYYARRRDGAAHKRNAYGAKRFRRQTLGCKPRPETVAVASYGCNACDSFAAHERVDFGALDIRCAVIAGGESGCVTRARPGRREPLRQVFWVRAEVERAGGVSPDLPGRRRGLQPVEEPCLLLGPKDRLWRIALAEVGDLLVAERDGVGGLAACVNAARIENLA